MSYCLYLFGGDRMEAEEAFCNARMLAFEKFHAGAVIEDLSSWIWKLTHNICIDALRNRKRREALYERLEEREEPRTEAALAMPDTPELLVLAEEQRMILEEAIETLSQELRLPFLFKYIHQHSFSEIARMLGISLDTTYKRIQKARDYLREQLFWYLRTGDGISKTPIGADRQPSSILSADHTITTDMTVVDLAIIFDLTATCLEHISCQHERYLDQQDWK